MVRRGGGPVDLGAAIGMQPVGTLPDAWHWQQTPRWMFWRPAWRRQSWTWESTLTRARQGWIYETNQQRAREVLKDKFCQTVDGTQGLPK